jgi:HlyD family secretion protein
MLAPAPRDGARGRCAMTAVPFPEVAPDAVAAPSPVAAPPVAAPPHRRVRWRVWALVALGATALGAGAGVWSRARQRPVAPQYLRGRVLRGDLDETIRATGSVQPVLQVQVGAQVSGRVLRVSADFNSVVRRGDLLAELDPTPYRAQVAQARAALGITRASRAQARANLTLAALALARARSLRARGLNAEADVEQSVAQHDAARGALDLASAQIAQAQAALGNAETSLSYTRILAPIDGTVATRSIDPGQTVAASFQTPTLFVIANDLTHMRVMADVDEANIGKLRVGMSAEARVDAFPANVYRGTVSQLRITPTTTSGVVTYATVIAVDNAAGELRPGMTATITVSTRHRAAVLSVPNAALRYRPAAGATTSGAAVHVVRGGVAARVAVTPGVTNGTNTEVTAPGINAGDEVVLDETDATGALAGARMRMF